MLTSPTIVKVFPFLCFSFVHSLLFRYCFKQKKLKSAAHDFFHNLISSNLLNNTICFVLAGIAYLLLATYPRFPSLISFSFFLLQILDFKFIRYNEKFLSLLIVWISFGLSVQHKTKLILRLCLQLLSFSMPVKTFLFLNSIRCDCLLHEF